ncbi:uncharacterized protein TNIN_198131 [Trichonephila inaurata madagascariensis]|uniref:Uncharacterized protein n=1 Tax=Trichonephila inaurata madagascariensis TaxID=2747483 RepID=A0A8X7CB96_9ARAC|nr:uncharacterized protein TNIN_198131 [Trichonephila inaurata madagascariensis]
MLQENASQLLPYRRRLERLAGIVKFQELLKQYPISVKVVLNEHGYHISDCTYIREKCTEEPDTLPAIPVVSDPCSCQRNCLVCGRGEEPPHDCAIHVLLESMVFQERMLYGEPTEARLEEILRSGKEYLPRAMCAYDRPK